MTDNERESELALRERLLPYVAAQLDENVLGLVADALCDLLVFADDELAVELLRPIFRNSHYWPVQIAQTCMGISNYDEDDLTCDQLLQLFENGGVPTHARHCPRGDVNWRENGF